jgi:hypothetical protein
VSSFLSEFRFGESDEKSFSDVLENVADVTCCMFLPLPEFLSGHGIEESDCSFAFEFLCGYSFDIGG